MKCFERLSLKRVESPRHKIKLPATDAHIHFGRDVGDQAHIGVERESDEKSEEGEMDETKHNGIISDKMKDERA